MRTRRCVYGHEHVGVVLWVSERRRGIVANCNPCRLENDWRMLLAVTPVEAGAPSETWE